MYPVFHVFGLELGIYGVFAATGLLLAGFISVKLGQKYFNISYEIILLAFVVSLLSGFILAHILFGITNTSNIIELSKKISELGFLEYIKQLFMYFTGMVFYGGFIGGVLGAYIFPKYFKQLKGHSTDMVDLFTVVFPLFHTFGRIGCFFGGCCYGIESPFGFRTDTNHINPSINGVTRFPVQLLEALLNLLIFFLMYYLFTHNKMRHKLVFVYMIVYGIIRFFDEFLRGDEYRGFIFSLSTSQFISIILIVFSVFMLIYLKFRRRNKNTTQNCS